SANYASYLKRPPPADLKQPPPADARHPPPAAWLNARPDATSPACGASTPGRGCAERPTRKQPARLRYLVGEAQTRQELEDGGRRRRQHRQSETLLHFGNRRQRRHLHAR